jgi:hypothetical protein
MRNKFVYLFLLLALMLTSAAAFAQTATPEPEPTTVPAPTLDLDVTPLFDSMNGYIPLFLAIFAIPGGIVIAIALVRMIIDSIGNAIKGAAGKG